MNKFVGKMGQPGDIGIEPWTPNYEQHPGVAGANAKQPYVDFGGGIMTDADKYSSRDVLEMEWDRLMGRTWHLVGHLNDIPEKDCYLTAKIGKEPFIVVRGDGDEIRGYYNVCQHRGTRLVEKDYGQSKRFGCPFHAWIYGNDGQLEVLPGRETFREETLCRNLDLEPVRVEQFGGFIFLNMASDAMSLADYLGDRFREVLSGYDLRNFVRLYDVRQVWDVNWKLGMEAFIEGYHVTAVHPELCTYMDDYYVQHDTYDNGHGRSIFPFMEPAQSYLRSVGGQINGLNDEMKLFLTAAGVSEGDYPERWQDVKRAVIAGKRKNQEKLGFDYSGFSDDQLVDDWNMSLFPCTTFNIHPEGVLLQRWQPDAHDPRKTHYSLQIYAMKGECVIPSYMPIDPRADRTGKRVLPVTYLEGMGGDAVGPVVMQDVAFIHRFQAGAESKGFRGAVLGEHEIRVRRFYDEYYAYMNRQK